VIASWLERAANLASALPRRSADDERMFWSRDRLEAWQRERLADIVRFASERAPFYREHFGGPVRGPVELAKLPVLTKETMMARFDDVVTDRRLRLADLLRHAAAVQGDELYLGEHRVMTSSGSSGRKAVYVYDRAAWRAIIMPANLRLSRMLGLAPRWPRPRLATVAAPDGKHMTFRGGASMDVGVFRSRRFSAAAPLAELAADLAAYRPEYIVGYPSTLAALADEQLAGRLRIAPKAIATSSEVRTDAMAEAMRRAWGIEPFNCLGLTETGITAVDCAEHQGMHLFEDLSIVEVVDAAGAPVPDGQPGAKILVTSLWNRVQPIVRFEVSDLVTVTSAVCACGRTFRRVVALDGRSDDLLELPSRAGGLVTVHPIHLRGALGRDPAVVQYQVTERRGAESGVELDVQVVLARDAAPDAAVALERRLVAALRAQGAEVAVQVRPVASIPREEGAGKLKLVRAMAREARAHTT
jgi:phenylacetate-coenzyme A ligase PaaK-like adenylate-forming protein